MRTILVGCLIVSMAGCSLIRPQTGEGVAASALPYRASLVRGEDRRDVTVTVKAAGASVEDVRESVRFPVTRYCISAYGGSEAEWDIGPSTGDWAFSRDGDNMVFSARCTTR